MTSRGLPSSNKQTLALSVEIGDSKRREAFSPPLLFTLLYLQYLGVSALSWHYTYGKYSIAVTRCLEEVPALEYWTQSEAKVDVIRCVGLQGCTQKCQQAAPEWINR